MLSRGNKDTSRSAGEGPSKGKKESTLDTLTNSINSLIELQKTRLEMEIRWRDEDKEREDEAEKKRMK